MYVIIDCKLLNIQKYVMLAAESRSQYDYNGNEKPNQGGG